MSHVQVSSTCNAVLAVPLSYPSGPIPPSVATVSRATLLELTEECKFIQLRFSNLVGSGFATQIRWLFHNFPPDAYRTSYLSSEIFVSYYPVLSLAMIFARNIILASYSML